MGQDHCIGKDCKYVVCFTHSFLVPMNMDNWQPLKTIMYVKILFHTVKGSYFQLNYV